MMFKPSVNELIAVANKNILNDTQKVKSKFKQLNYKPFIHNF